MFISTYESAIDDRGRISVPAPFRAALGEERRVFLWPALDGTHCLEGGGVALMDMYKRAMGKMSPQSKIRKALVNGLFARAADLRMDEGGRIKLPPKLLDHAGLEKAILFTGNVDSFNMWNPERYAEYDSNMAQAAAEEDTLDGFADAFAQITQLNDGDLDA